MEMFQSKFKHSGLQYTSQCKATIRDRQRQAGRLTQAQRETGRQTDRNRERKNKKKKKKKKEH